MMWFRFDRSWTLYTPFQCWLLLCLGINYAQAARPNVLIAISDDQSYPHASAYGQPVVKTPGFDEVARRGVLFHNAFTPAPGCSPMRAAFLTGQYIWQIREAGTHASHFPKDLPSFPWELAKSGYRIGYTGKPWGPGNYKISGWDQNPAGPSVNSKTSEAPKGISNTDYAANFGAFLDSQVDQEPFCFWYGGHEPHRAFGAGLGAKSGMDAAQVEVPEFLPDSPEVRSDLLDYFYEIQWFDQHLARMLKQLEARGMLENTLVIVTSDNGMSFPRAKANLYEYGIHMPLAISWPARYQGGQVANELVNLIDVTATIYEACEVAAPSTTTGNSLTDILQGSPSKPRAAVFSGRERHSSARFNSLGYPCRCVRTENFLYLRNYAPERWPAGAPQAYSMVKYDAQNQVIEASLESEHSGYHDIDACPSLDFMVANRNTSSVAKLLSLAVGVRPAEEFFDIRNDRACLENLADSPQFQSELTRHRQLLTDELIRTGDLRQIDFAASQVWESYPRYSALRWFPTPNWVKQNPEKVFPQTWLDQRRPH